MDLSMYFVFFRKTALEFVLGENNIAEFLGEEYDREMVEGSKHMRITIIIYIFLLILI